MEISLKYWEIDLKEKLNTTKTESAQRENEVFLFLLRALTSWS
jgi:hypothetical protein